VRVRIPSLPLEVQVSTEQRKIVDPDGSITICLDLDGFYDAMFDRGVTVPGERGCVTHEDGSITRWGPGGTTTWTHTVCDGCWNEKNPGRRAVRVVSPDYEREPCCFCGNLTASGIYLRSDPANHPNCTHN
jgi:hypothetical protein